MRQVVLQMMVGLIGLFALSAFAETPNPRAEVRKGLVSVLTDGITDPNGGSFGGNGITTPTLDLGDILPIGLHLFGLGINGQR